MNFEKSRKLSKKVIFWAIYKWLAYCVLMASDLDFHVLANGRSDGDLYVRQILLNIPVYVQL